MQERPILFSGAMVRAILDGRKTQTRRVISTRHPIEFLGGRGQESDLSAWGWFFDGPEHSGYMVLARGMNQRHEHGCVSIPCPYGEPGDRLWVRETWRAETSEEVQTVYYRADEEWHKGAGWKPSIHMPRWASRLTLEVTEARVQRLQEISEEDAEAEGCPGARGGGHPAGDDGMTPREEYRVLWDSINGERQGCSWADDPWVWAVSFKVVTP